jgi:hypothetical protein
VVYFATVEIELFVVEVERGGGGVFVTVQLLGILLSEMECREMSEDGCLDFEQVVGVDPNWTTGQS